MEPKRTGRPQGSKNKPKPRIEMIDINRPLQYEAAVEVQLDTATSLNKLSSTERKKEEEEKSLNEWRRKIAAQIRRAQTVAGPCHIKGCSEPSKFISRSETIYKRFCGEHAAANVDEYPDLVDKLGLPFLNYSGPDRVLFIDRNSWRFVQRDGESFQRYVKWYIPLPPAPASAYIHFEMMHDAFKLASIGIPVDKIWGVLTGNIVAPIPLELESQFLDLLHEESEYTGE